MSEKIRFAEDERESPAPETPTASSPLSSRASLHDFFQDDPVGSGNPIRRRRSPAPDGVRC
ncbi:hypothetical protein T08_5613 [Trichinella sp. T8]|nr:hypothetical protein T08_5613 [Trichinella sp. T8]